MKKEEIDRLITESLSREEAQFYKSLEQEENIFVTWKNIYKGSNGWLAAIVTLVMFIATPIAVYYGYLFFTQDSVVEMLRHGAIMFIGLLVVSILKTWLFMQMDKNTVLREFKKMEYQVAVLMEKTGGK
jgi:small-conductance mechanosensitive channel